MKHDHVNAINDENKYELNSPTRPKKLASDEQEFYSPERYSDKMTSTSVISPNKTTLTTPSGRQYKYRQPLGNGSSGQAEEYVDDTGEESRVLKTEKKRLGRDVQYDHNMAYQEYRVALKVYGAAGFICTGNSESTSDCDEEGCTQPHSISMPSLPGVHLNKFYRNYCNGKSDEEIEAFLVVLKEQILAAVKEFHFQTGMVHCDLKADNLLVHDDGMLVVYLVDFGSATKVGDFPRSNTVNLRHYPESFVSGWGDVLRAAQYEFDFAAVESIIHSLKSSARVENLCDSSSDDDKNSEQSCSDSEQDLKRRRYTLFPNLVIADNEAGEQELSCSMLSN